MKIRTVNRAAHLAAIVIATATPLAAVALHDATAPEAPARAAHIVLDERPTEGPAGPWRVDTPPPRRASAQRPVGPAPAQTAVRTERVPQKPVQPVAPQKPKAAPAGTRITAYRDCTGNPQPCIDAGSLTLYGRDHGVSILAGHNYNGFQWLSRQPVGGTVTVTGGAVAGTYRVTGHMRLNRQSGALPDFGGADLVLQSCEGRGTGFSLLRRVA